MIRWGAGVLVVARALFAQAQGDEAVVVRHHQVTIDGRTFSSE